SLSPPVSLSYFVFPTKPASSVALVAFASSSKNPNSLFKFVSFVHILPVYSPPFTINQSAHIGLNLNTKQRKKNNVVQNRPPSEHLRPPLERSIQRIKRPTNPKRERKAARDPSWRCGRHAKVLSRSRDSRPRRHGAIPILPPKPLGSPSLLRQALRAPRSVERYGGFLVRLHAGVRVQHGDAHLLHPHQRYQADMVLLRHRPALSGRHDGRYQPARNGGSYRRLVQIRRLECRADRGSGQRCGFRGVEFDFRGRKRRRKWKWWEFRYWSCPRRRERTSCLEGVGRCGWWDCGVAGA
ncbi:unnamed protein product, partial [Tuber aestivum]